MGMDLGVGQSPFWNSLLAQVFRITPDSIRHEVVQRIVRSAERERNRQRKPSFRSARRVCALSPELTIGDDVEARHLSFFSLHEAKQVRLIATFAVLGFQMDVAAEPAVL